VSAHRKFTPTLPQLAASYRTSKQRVHQLVADHGFDAVADPARLFSILLGRTASPLRSRLSDPGERARIRAEIASYSPGGILGAAFRQGLRASLDEAIRLDP